MGPLIYPLDWVESKARSFAHMSARPFFNKRKMIHFHKVDFMLGRARNISFFFGISTQ